METKNYAILITFGGSDAIGLTVNSYHELTNKEVFEIAVNKMEYQVREVKEPEVYFRFDKESRK